jgi:hydrogenase maturation protein HypF
MATKVKALSAYHIKIGGVVQGVGFRPFVYRLAHRYGISGWVRNTSSGVEIEVEGGKASLRRFIHGLKTEAPPMSTITSLETTAIPPNGYRDFEIRESLALAGEYQLISPDIATCRDCERELFSLADRRYRYPFTNCTNCGPRFTIIKRVPYDREFTTMRDFKMCPECQREYDDPLNRRFHAQPNACPHCGPHLELVDAEGKKLDCPDVIRKTAELLEEGRIVAIKGLGGFQLACDATNGEVVRKLRERKKRPAKPFAVMMASLEEVKRHCRVTSEEEKLLTSPQSPIVLLCWCKELSAVAGEIAPNLLYLGVMLPYTPLHHLLMREVNRPLVLTSGNLSEEPIATDNGEALRRLNGTADYYLWHNRDIYARYDDSVFLVEGSELRPVRRARGYAPYPIFLPFKAREVLATGGEEKNTFCLTRGNYAFLSQHIGDMENEETLEHYENTLNLYKKLFRIEPKIIAYDMHPEYLATKFALSLKSQANLKFVPVQHHHAHIVSCMAENGVSSPVIGVAFDGTGYGPDGAIWGGEFLICDNKGFRRAGHLEYVPMPGGTMAIKKPYRMALSYVYSLLGKDFSLEGLPLLENLDGKELEIITRQIERGINSPLTSSVGRLFDAVAALTGIRGVVDYEAQAAMELEMWATDEIERASYEPYPFTIDGNECRVVRLTELISAVVWDIKQGTPVPIIAARFHKTVAQVVVEMCRLIAEASEQETVALSGGVFQNRVLTRLVTSALKERGFKVLTHHLVPCNDGGLSLGQAVIGSFAVD